MYQVIIADDEAKYEADWPISSHGISWDLKSLQFVLMEKRPWISPWKIQ